MLASSRRKRVGASIPSGSQRSNRANAEKKFNSKFKKSKSWPYWQYIIWGGVVIGLTITVFLFYSLVTNSKHPHKPIHAELDPNNILVDENGNIDFNRLNNMVEEAKKTGKGMKEINEVLSSMHEHGPDHKMRPPHQPNAVQVTFNVYSNPTCDESDPSSFTTVTKSSTQVDVDSVNQKDEECPLCYSFCKHKINENDAEPMNLKHKVQSIKITSNEIAAQLDLYSDCGLTQYHSSIFEFEGCVHIFEWPNTAGIKVIRNYLDFPQKLPRPIDQSKLPPLQDHLLRDGISEESKELSTQSDVPSYVITYSCESSEYCAFQAQANYYAFLTSGQHPTKSNFLRLLTSQEPDDMAQYVPTFTAPRNLYSRRYSPYNKADVMVKWFESPANKPKEEIIVVIDPDNWIIRDITHWIVRAKEGHALGEAAWFHGSGLVTQLWKEVCLQNCDYELDMVGVPYIVHRNDLEKIAPFFKLYINIMKEREEADPSFTSKYKGIQMGWGTEMFGYIFAAAHVGIKHEVVHGIQRRDVSARPNNKKEELSIDMIHMGRAWFPKTYEPAKIWWHTEGKAWSRFGAQVWCKCNYTASDIIPWPLPSEEDGGVDFQSYHTLYLLHHGREYFGPLPASKYRKPSKRYHEPYP